MLVWLIKEGEYLPVQAGSRKMRSWLLAEALVERGHEVIWWHSTFSHQTKTLLAERDHEVQVGDRFRLKLTHAGRYAKNFSLRRYYHGKRLARRFAARIEREPAPDLIVCAYPPIDIAFEAVRYGRRRGIPVVIDVQDVWPDAILKKLPEGVRSAGRLLLSGDFRRTRQFLAGADAIVAVSPGFLRRTLGYAGREGERFDRVFPLAYPSRRGEGEPSLKVRQLQEETAGNVLFTYIGSFGLSYELRLLCAVAARLAALQCPLHFAFAGGGEQYQEIERLARGIPNVTLMGWLNEAELQQLLAVSDVGLVPCISDVDTMPNKPFEYFSHGLPILSSLEGDMERLIDEQRVGFSYRHGDGATLEQLVLRLVESRALRDELGRNALKLFAQRYRAEEVYPGFAAHLEALWEKRKGSHG